MPDHGSRFDHHIPVCAREAQAEVDVDVPNREKLEVGTTDVVPGVATNQRRCASAGINGSAVARLVRIPQGGGRCIPPYDHAFVL